ncbi:hypothetical protein G6F56_009947 [Rhizopus delemar]|nr:hypothetical protein G6F56_009947 [Rhizopus delemar]
MNEQKIVPSLQLDFPYGAQPDIIRANQKDIYYQSILQEQLTRIVQQFLGTRVQHLWQKEIDALSSFCYYSLTTLLGTQTLGEEYCDLVQLSQSAQTYPSLIIFTRQLGPHEQRAGYEVLGGLIMIQLSIQAFLALRKRIPSTLTKEEKEKEEEEEEEEEKVVAEDDYDFMDSIDRVDEQMEEKELGYEELQRLKCALCLETRTITTIKVNLG